MLSSQQIKHNKLNYLYQHHDMCTHIQSKGWTVKCSGVRYASILPLRAFAIAHSLLQSSFWWAWIELSIVLSPYWYFSVCCRINSTIRLTKDLFLSNGMGFSIRSPSIYQMKNIGDASASTSITVIGGSDVPAYISIWYYLSVMKPVLISVLAAITSVVGLYRTRKN